MAPRKRASSGGKKPSNPSREQLQSQPSKFGIQHFFERHSQSQKPTSQKRDDHRAADSAANQNSQIVPEPIVNRAEAGPENPGAVASLGKIEPRTKHMRGENPRSNSVNAVVIDVDDGVSRNTQNRNDVPVVNRLGENCESTTEIFDDGVVGINDLEIRDMPTNNLMPVVNDHEENQMEVSPEPSKSVSVKRFKFSPGMLIKQSQDDIADEVTWKISPVNERLHAMSKNLPGRIRVLADSTRFNSVTFQECSQEKFQVKTSPNMSGKLEKWLSSPPLKPHKKPLICSDGLASRKLNRGHDLSCAGNNRNMNSSDKSELPNTQSPFCTPPSLSCCHNKAVEEVDFKGVPDQLGSRQHKKMMNHT